MIYLRYLTGNYESCFMQIINSPEAIKNLVKLNPCDQNNQIWLAEQVLKLLRIGDLAAVVQDSDSKIVFLHQRKPTKAILKLAPQSIELAATDEATELAESQPEIVYRGGVISSSDPDAIALLKSKQKQLEQLQERMKQATKLAKKDDAEGLADMGYTQVEVSKLLNPEFSYYRPGYQSFELSNNNQVIRATKDRIKDLESQQDWESETYEALPGLTVEEDIDANRIRLVFDAKPNAQARKLLRQRGFKWSPNNQAWQRMLNAQGKSTVQWTIETLETENLI